MHSMRRRLPRIRDGQRVAAGMLKPNSTELAHRSFTAFAQMPKQLAELAALGTVKVARQVVREAANHFPHARFQEGDAEAANFTAGSDGAAEHLLTEDRLYRFDAWTLKLRLACLIAIAGSGERAQCARPAH
jgi:hypothetical protein